MRIQRNITQVIALSLAILLGVGNAPLSAAEVATPANIGSVSAVGSVQLRGVGISEGTLFSGDRVNVAPGSYAKVVLGSGPKVELGGTSNTDIVVSKDNDAVNIQLKAGNMAFMGNGGKPVHVQVGAYEVIANGQARGTVAFVGSGAFGVRVIDGTVTVRDTKTKQSYTVAKGTEKILSLQGAGPVGVQLASAMPTAIPAAPAMPATPQTSGGKRTALLIGAVLGSAAAIAVLMTKNDDSDLEASSRLRRTQFLATAAAAGDVAAAVQTNAQAITSATQTAVNIINNNATINLPANANAKANLLVTANAAITKANSASNTVISLQAQINQLEAQIEASGTITQAQQDLLDSLLAQLEAARKQANDALNDLDKLINDANNLAGGNIINDPNLDPVDGLDNPSPSNP